MEDDKKPANYFEGPYKAEVSTNRLILEVQGYVNAQLKQYRDYTDKYIEMLLRGVNDKLDAYMKSAEKANILMKDGLDVHLATLNNHAEKYLAQLNTSATKDQVQDLDNSLKERIADAQKNMSHQTDLAVSNLQKQITELKSNRDTLSGGFQATKIIANLGYLAAGLIIGALVIWFNFFKG